MKKPLKGLLISLLIASIVIVAALVFIFIYSSSSSISVEEMVEEKKTLRIFDVINSIDIPTSVVMKFAEERRISVFYDRIDGTKFDIILFPADTSRYAIQSGLRPLNKKYLERINPLVLERISYLDTNYLIPFYWGTTGMVINKANISSYEKSWSIHSKGIYLIDDMRSAIGWSLAYLGLSVNSVDPIDLNNAHTRLKSIPLNLQGFYSNLIPINFNVLQIYSERLNELKIDIDFFIPPHSLSYVYCIGISPEANMEAAESFIDYLFSPEVYAKFSDELSFPPIIIPSAQEYKKVQPLYTSEDLMSTEILKDVGEGIILYTKVWSDIIN